MASATTAPAAVPATPPKPLPKDPPPGFGIPEKRGSTSDDRSQHIVREDVPG